MAPVRLCRLHRHRNAEVKMSAQLHYFSPAESWLKISLLPSFLNECLWSDRLSAGTVWIVSLWSQTQESRIQGVLELKRSHFTSNSSPCCALSANILPPLFLSTAPPLAPTPPQVLRCLSAPANPKEQKAWGCVMAYGYLTPASPLIRLSSLNDATCGGTNATEKSIKAFH